MAPPRSKAPASSDRKPSFDPRNLDRTVIAIPLLKLFELDREAREKDANREAVKWDIIVDLNLDFAGGRKKAFQQARRLIQEIIDPSTQLRVRSPKSAQSKADDADEEDTQYLFVSLPTDVIRALVSRDQKGRSRTQRAIYRIWPDFPLKPLIFESVRTVKADAARNSFGAHGDEIVWAVLDSGIDGTHPHFDRHKNLELDEPLRHRDFTSAKADPLRDDYGHGTHVAGIIAGEMLVERKGATRKGLRESIAAMSTQRNENGEPVPVRIPVDAIAGMAPRCKLMSLKVLDDDGKGNGTGKTSSIIAAIQYIQELNGYGRRILVHGVNLSLGYEFEPEWFACGQSPLCVEINRLVKSGVVVVVAAGNSGYGFLQSKFQDQVEAGLGMTINDPGNADLAITVGSTHRNMPHVYGVSYFSSKGPTGDGRMKPDLLAPGEKIISCDSAQRSAAGKRAARPRGGAVVGRYREDSGTSMAAPHVSGVIAAFLSVRREFIQRPEEVKRIFLSSATDLGRVPYFQGRGLIDLMRAIQSV